MNKETALVAGIPVVIFMILIMCVRGSTIRLPEDIQKDYSPPKINHVYLEPKKVREGDIMVIAAEVSDKHGVKTVNADMGGIETVDLELAEGNLYHGHWETKWLVHDTEPIDYIANITATNVLGVSSFVIEGWSDPPLHAVSEDLELKVFISKEELKLGESLSVTGSVFYKNEPLTNNTVNIRINDRTFSVETNGFGSFSYKFTPESSGSYFISVQTFYSGYATEGTGQIHVTPVSSELGRLVLKIQLDKQVFKLGEIVPISGVVYYDNKPLETKVNIKINSEEFVIDINSSGHYHLEYEPSSAGKYVVTIQAVKHGEVTVATQTTTIIDVLKKGGAMDEQSLTWETTTTVFPFIKENPFLIEYGAFKDPRLEKALQGLRGGDKIRVILKDKSGTLSPMVVKKSKLNEIEKNESLEYIYLDDRVSVLTYLEIIRWNRSVLEFNLTGENKSLCILDTGINSSLVNYTGGYDFIGNDTIPEDGHGHGTAMALVIKTIAPKSELYVAKVLDENGTGYESDVLAGLQWCMEQEPDVISFSIGSGSYDGFCDSNLVANMSNQAFDQGSFVVAASGNSGNTSFKAPACGSRVFSVGSTFFNDSIASFSSVNPTLDLFAPSQSGTSYSAAQTSASSLLVLENESLNVTALKYMLRSTGVPIVYDYNSTLGLNISRLDLYNAITNNKTMEPYNYSWYWQAEGGGPYGPLGDEECNEACTGDFGYDNCGSGYCKDKKAGVECDPMLEPSPCTSTEDPCDHPDSNILCTSLPDIYCVCSSEGGATCNSYCSEVTGCSDSYCEPNRPPPACDASGCEVQGEECTAPENYDCDPSSCVCNKTATTTTTTTTIPQFPDCGSYINESKDLDQNVTGCDENNIFYINASDIVLDCHNYYLESNASYGINNTGHDNVTIKNCEINMSSSTSDRAIEFINAENGTIINNIITVGRYYGIRVYSNGNVRYYNIDNNTLTTQIYGFYFNSNPGSYNNITNNNITATVDYASNIYRVSNSTFSNNNIEAGDDYGAYFYQGSNNNITGGSIRATDTMDYYINGIGSTYFFRNTNFTDSRQIYFLGTSWFNYNNDTTGGIWLNSTADKTSNIERELISLTQDLVQWNETNTSGTGVTMTYNISGLLGSTTYKIYNNSVLAYTRQTHSSGYLNFTILLGSEHNITVWTEEEEPQTYECDSCSDCNTKIGNANAGETVKLNTSINNHVGTCIDFNKKDNITFDCHGNTIEGDEEGTDYGIHLSYDKGDGSNYNTITNCTVKKFSTGIYIDTSSNNTLYNNTLTDNVPEIMVYYSYGIYLDTGSNNILTNNTASNNDYGIFLNSNSNYNNITNNTFSNNQYYGVYLSSSSYNNITRNVVSFNEYSQGIELSSSSHNKIEHNTANNQQYGIRLSSSSNNTLTNNTANNNNAGITLVSSSNYNNITNNTANNNTGGGIDLHSSSNNTISNNTFNNGHENGISFYSSSSNNTIVKNNLINNLVYGIIFDSSSDNSVKENLIEKNIRDLRDDSQNYYQNNQFTDNDVSKIITVSFNNKTPDVNDLVEFNISVYYPNGSAHYSPTDNTYTKPSETVDSSVSENKIMGNFTPTENGLYSLVVNITDSEGNWVKRKYNLFINSTSKVINYYIRPDAEPTHGQPNALDARSLLFDAPATESNFTCGTWIQASPDNISSTPFGYLQDINISSWYKVGGTAYIGLQRYANHTISMDENQSIPPAGDYIWDTTNFTQLGWTIDYIREWYWFSIKLSGSSPSWKTNQTHPSYVNMSYIYSDKPEIKSLTNIENVTLLSATSPTSEENNATIYLEGEGITNLTVKMPNIPYVYNASYDGVYCDGSNANCNMSQFSGELEFALSLGSEHNVTVWTEEENEPPVFGYKSFQEGTGGYSGTDDTFIADGTSLDPDQEDTNYENNSDEIYVYNSAFGGAGATTSRTGLVYFNLSSISNQSEVTFGNMSMYLYETSANSLTISAYLINKSWIVNETTWNNRTSSLLWDKEGGDYNSTATGGVSVTTSLGWYDWNITPDVNKWVDGVENNGTLFRPSSPGGLNTYIKKFRDDRNGTYSPKLEVNFTIKNQTWSYNSNNTNINLTKFFFDENDLNYTYDITGSSITVEINNDTGQVKLIPDTDWSGIQYVVFTATDGEFTDDSNNVTLNVTGPQTYECNSCSDCNTKIGNANAGDTVKLNTSIDDDDGTCIDFNGKDNITFDCHGNTIDGDDTGTGNDYGIYLANTGGGSNYNTIKNCTVKEFYRNIYVYSSSSNTFENNTLNESNKCIFLNSNSKENNFTDSKFITCFQAAYVSLSSTDNTFTNNAFISNGEGFSLDTGSDNNTFINNTFEYNQLTFYFTTDGHTIINNTFISNSRVFSISLNSNYHNISGNKFKNNMQDLDIDSSIPSPNYFDNNQFKDSSVPRMITSSFSNRTPDLNNLVEFNFSIYYPNGTACSSFTINNLRTYPNETLEYSTDGENVTGNFTPTENGIYSLVINVSDSEDNWARRKYTFFVNLDTTPRITNYYIRPDVEPSHEQAHGGDARSLLFEAPATESNFTCGSWIQASPDNISSTPFGYFQDINISYWYVCPTTICYVGVQRYGLHGSDMDENQSVPGVSGSWVWNATNFTQLNWATDYHRSWRWLAIKLKGSSPRWYTNQTHPSYVNMSYYYSDKPEIKNLTNVENVILLSATSLSSEEDNATIYLEGTGDANLTVQMLQTYAYNASYDGVYCDGSNANCNVSQSSGELEFALSLGSEHNITVWTEEENKNPLWQNQGSNASGIQPDDAILLYAQGKDDTGLDWAWLWTNETGGAGKNYTASDDGDDLEMQENATNWTNSTGWDSGIAEPTYDPTQAFDDDWNTYARTLSSTSGTLWMNYTIPGYAHNNSKWETKTGGMCGLPGDIENLGYCFNSSSQWQEIFNYTNQAATAHNDSIPSSCMAGSVLQLKIESYPDLACRCYIYEERVWWNLSGVDYIYAQDMGDAVDTWTWSNFTWKNSSLSSGTNIVWKIYYNDTSGNENVTDEMSFNLGLSCGSYVNEDTTLTDNITGCTGTILYINASDVTLDCNGHYLQSDAGDLIPGINNTGHNNVTIKNCEINMSDINGDHGIYYYSSHNGTIENNTITVEDYYGIRFQASSNNTVTDNIIKVGDRYGIHVNSGSNYTTITNNNITATVYYGIYVQTNSHYTNITGNNITANNRYALLLISSDNNTVSDNNLTGGTGGYTLYISSSNYNNLTENNIETIGNYGVYFNSGDYNNFTGGSIRASGYDYRIPTSSRNSFRNTNFTDSRQIYFGATTALFNYNNQTSGGVWLNTSSDTSARTITRKLINLNQTLVQWNDSSSAAMTATYNISGLLADSYYRIYNNSILAYTLQTDSNGVLPSFEIYLDSEHEIRVKYYTAPMFGFVSYQEGTNGYKGTDDTFIRTDGYSGEDDINYENSSEEIHVRKDTEFPSSTRHGLVKFDLSSISTNQSEVIFGNLSLYKYSGESSSQDFYAYTILHSWLVNETTWNSRWTGQSWDTSGGDYNSTPTVTISVGGNGWYSFNITSDVVKWIENHDSNNGTLLRTYQPGATTHFDRYFRDDRNPTYGPIMEVNFTIKNQTWEMNTNDTLLNLTKFFFDDDNDDLNYTADITGSSITVEINNDTGQVKLVPDDIWFGTEYVVFTATDGINTTDSNNVTLTVTPGCGAYLNSDTTLIDNITGCTATILYINASDVTLDCQNHYLQSSGNYGINNTNHNNVTVKNCEVNMSEGSYGIRFYNTDSGNIENNTITVNSYSAIQLYSGSDYNTISNNTIMAGTYAIYLPSGCDHNYISDNNLKAGSSTVWVYSNTNNSFVGGSIRATSNWDYYLRNAGSTNSFRNTNFTVPREFYLYETTDWFNYNNDTTDGIWLNTSIDTTTDYITRGLINLNQTLVQWNDTASSALTATYNISGLEIETYYDIYNNSVLAYTLQTDSNGILPSFTIYHTGIEQNIVVSLAVTYCNDNYIKGQGNWNVTSGITCSDEIIYLDQDSNLSVITNSGSLTFKNITLWLNLTSDGNSRIRVYSGGAMNVTDNDGDGSLINSTDSSNEFGFVVDSGSTFSMINSELSECGWEESEGGRGLEINTTQINFTGNNVSNSFKGIILYSDNNTISRNNFISTGSHAIFLYFSNNNTMEYNDFTSVPDESIYLTYSNYNIIRHHTIEDSGINMEVSNHSIITNNSVTNSAGNGIKLYKSDNNTISNNVFNDNSQGFELLESCDNNLTSNTANSNTWNGIYIDDHAHRNKLVNNTFDLNYVGIFIDAHSDNNTIISNYIYNSSNHCIRVEGSNNTLFQDCIIKNSTNYDIRSTGYAGAFTNNTFLNTTFNKSKTYFEGNATIYVQWYLDVNVTNSTGSPLDQANVSAWENHTGGLFFTKLTNSSGFITRQNVTEYFENLTQKHYYTNYTIDTAKSTYETDLRQLNLTESTQLDIILSKIDCGSYINKSTTLDHDITGCTATILYINASDVTLDCHNHYLESSAVGNSYSGINNTGFENVTIRNCQVNMSDISSYQAVYFDNADNGTIENNTVTVGVYKGIYLNFSSYGSISNNTVSTNSDQGIYLSSCDHSNITDNNVTINKKGGIYLYNSSYNNITNNNATSTYTGLLQAGDAIHLTDNSSYNIISNNNAKVNKRAAIRIFNSHNNTVSSNNAEAIDFTVVVDGDNNTLTNNNITSETNVAIYLSDCSYNKIIGGSIKAANRDYYFSYANSTNYFRNTNFTASREIEFDSDSWFNYNNETTGGIWVNTSANDFSYIRRELTNLNQTLVQWNDTNTSGTDVTATYNISGLVANKLYNIYNNSVLVDTKKTDGSGVLPSFDIYLGSEHEIKVEKTLSCGDYVNESTNLDHNITGCTATILYINASDVTLDCNGHYLQSSGDYGINVTNQNNVTIKNCEINMSDSAGDYGIYFNDSDSGIIDNNTVEVGQNRAIHLGYSNYNNITKNDARAGNDYGLYLSYSSNNTISNNTFEAGDQSIYLSYSSNNTISNNTATANNQYALRISTSQYNTISNNTLTADDHAIYFIGTSSHNVEGGSIRANTHDYGLGVSGSTNSFRVTNFTDARQIHFYDIVPNSWFNYNNDTTEGIWINTSLSNNDRTLTRKLVNLSQTLVQWNDSSSLSTTAAYNISGLYNNTYYKVYNNSELLDTLVTDADGVLPSFDIYLGSEHNITVEKQTCSLAMGFSLSLLNGIEFGELDPINDIQDASENNGSGSTNYSVLVQINYCYPNTANIWTSVNQSFNTSMDDSIPYTRYFHRYNETNDTVPGSSQTSYDLGYQQVGGNLEDGNKTYLKFFMNVSTHTVPGTYDSFTFFKLNLTG